MAGRDGQINMVGMAGRDGSVGVWIDASSSHGLMTCAFAFSIIFYAFAFWNVSVETFGSSAASGARPPGGHSDIAMLLIIMRVKGSDQIRSSL